MKIVDHESTGPAFSRDLLDSVEVVSGTSRKVFGSRAPKILQNLAHTCCLARPGLALHNNRLSGMTDVQKDLVKIWRLDKGELRKPLRHKDFFDQLLHSQPLSTQPILELRKARKR